MTTDQSNKLDAIYNKMNLVSDAELLISYNNNTFSYVNPKYFEVVSGGYKVLLDFSARGIISGYESGQGQYSIKANGNERVGTRAGSYFNTMLKLFSFNKDEVLNIVRTTVASSSTIVNSIILYTSKE